MDIHYNAFISYRHHPQDIKVATQIQRLLEHYKVPRSLRKNAKGITRLFRDKDELPITSNLTTDITQALANSDYLIVICSTHTQESVWVQREIETFLSTHDRSKVLTVLVDGEPYDTIPEILLKEELTDPVTGEITVKNIEPLSCDWRVSPRKARREELPRLAAALLGCGYNELRQRERQYRTRRMIAAFSAAMAVVLAFLGYFIHSNVQIQQANDQLNIANDQLNTANTQLQDANEQIRANLDQALRNQSLFLANTATDLMEDGDRLTAIALALEALPQQEGERPYTAEAELALSAAVGTYQVKETVMAVGAMDCDYLIRDFKLSEDGALTYIQDDRYVVTVWDNKTLEKIGTAALDYPASRMIPTSGGNMLIFSDWGYKVYCCDPNGNILWSAADCKDISVLEGQDVLMVVNSIYTDFTTPYQFRVRFLDMHTGEEVREAIAFEGPDSSTAGIYFLQDASPAGMPVGLRLSGWDTDQIYMMDPDLGTVAQIYTFLERSIKFTGRTAEGYLLCLHNDGSFSMRGTYDNMITTQKDTFTLSCLDHITGQVLWESAFSTYVYGGLYTLEMIPGSSNILCQLDNAFLVLDSATGQILGRCDTASRPIWTNVGPDSTLFLLENGYMGTYNYSRDECSSYKNMPSDLVIGEIMGGAYVARDLSTQVTVYRNTKDESWVPYGGEYKDASIHNRLLINEFLVIQTNYNVYVIDTERNTLVWSDGKETGFNTDLLGVSNDAATVWCMRSDTDLVGYDLRTGAWEQIPLPRNAGEENCYLTGEHHLVEDKVYYIGRGYNTDILYLFCYDIQSGEAVCWNICTEQHQDVWGVQKTKVLLFADTYILLWENTNKAVYELDLKTGAAKTVMTEVANCPAAMAYDHDRYLLGANHEIQRRNRNGDVEMTIRLDGSNAGGFCLYEDKILALCDDGSVYCYSADGRYVANIGLYLYSTFQSDMAEDPFALKWNFTDDGTLILDVYGYGNIIDCDSWQLKAYVKDLMMYLPEEDAMVISVSGVDGGIGECPRISTLQLIQKAKETLGSFELTEEQRVLYGLLED